MLPDNRLPKPAQNLGPGTVRRPSSPGPARRPPFPFLPSLSSLPFASGRAAKGPSPGRDVGLLPPACRRAVHLNCKYSGSAPAQPGGGGSGCCIGRRARGCPVGLVGERTSPWPGERPRSLGLCSAPCSGQQQRQRRWPAPRAAPHPAPSAVSTGAT